jgi:archaellum component FlaG (FlaF/FlaG flagellin family)
MLENQGSVRVVIFVVAVAVAAAAGNTLTHQFFSIFHF